MDDAQRQMMAQALMGQNPMADHMGQVAQRQGDAAGNYRFERNLTGAGALALGGMGAAVPAGIAGFWSLVNHLRAQGADQKQAEAIAAQQMWANTGMPGRPTGEY